MHRVFFLLNVAIATWAFSYWRWLLSDNYTDALFWARMLSVGSTFIPIFFLHWILLLVGKTKKKKILLCGGYLMTVIFLLFGFSSWFVKTVEPRFGFPFWPIPGVLYHFYVLFSYISLLGYGIYQLFVCYHQARGHLRTQMKYIFLGLAIAAPAGFSNFLLWYNINFPPYLNIFVLSYMGCYAYAMLRYRLMDIRVALGKTAVYLLSFLATIGTSFLLMFANNRLTQPISQNVILPTTIIIAILFYQLFFRLFQKLASRYFYYSFYSSQKVLTELGEKLVKILDISELSNTIAQTLISTMKLDRTVVLFRTNRGRYEILKNIGFKEENGISLVRDNFLTEFLEKTQKPLVFEELSLIQKDLQDSKEKQNIQKLQGNMKSIEANVCLPLFIGKDITGIVILGKKVSGDSYCQEYMGRLTTLANQTSIAFENAKLYDEVQDLSQNLQEKVKEQTKDLQQALDELTRINKAKSEFLSMASHQLRTPLTAIKGYLSMIQEGDYGKTARPMLKPLINMLASVERLIKLINDLLGISKIELGSMKIDRKPIQIEELLQSCFEEIKPRAEEKKLEFTFQKPKTLLPKIMADELAIRQVMLNLLDNAIRYTEKGSIILAVEQKAGKVLIKVKDTGEGLTLEEKKNLFQSFARGSAGTDLFIEGTGLGLCVAKKYIDLHQGTIRAESPGKGRGSTFFVELPTA